jgi:predicted metal-dependent hydrolase
MPTNSTLDPHVLEGIRLFNNGLYFEAHEALESAWRNESGPIRDLYKGILQVAVCYLHITRRNFEGAQKMFTRSQKWLAPWPDVVLGIHVAQLIEDLAHTMTELQNLGPSGINSFDVSLLRPIAVDEPGSSTINTSKMKILVCDRCGTSMVSTNCKITCPNCGNRFDCSDLNLYFDELK